MWYSVRNFQTYYYGLVYMNLVILYSEHFTPAQHSISYPICGRKKLLNEMVILTTKILKRGSVAKRSEKLTRTRKVKTGKCILICEGKYMDEDTGSPSDHTTVSDTKMNGMIL